METECQVSAMLLFLRLFIARVREMLPTASVEFGLCGRGRIPFDEATDYEVLERFMTAATKVDKVLACAKFRIGDYRLNMEFDPEGRITVYRNRPGVRATADFLLDAQSETFVAAVFDEFIQTYSTARYERRGNTGSLSGAGYLEFGPAARVDH